jgi:hypothetical protein
MSGLVTQACSASVHLKVKVEGTSQKQGVSVHNAQFVCLTVGAKAETDLSINNELHAHTTGV